MMKRLLSVLLLTTLLLVGCSASTVQVSDSAVSGGFSAEIAPEAPMDNGSYGKGDYEYGWAEDSASGGVGVTPPTTDAAPDGLVRGKIIYTADVTLETRDFDLAGSEISALVTALGGYFESRELNQGGSYRSVYCVIRIPAERYSEFLSRAGEVAHMSYCNEYSQDVSETYYDLEARLATQRTKLARLQELLAQAKDMSDIITIESAISDTELQIEYLTGSLRKYDSLIDYSTVNLSLREVYRLSNEEPAPVTFRERVGAAFERGLEQLVENMEDLVIFVAMNWLTLIVYAVIITGVVILIRRKLKARRAGTLPAAPADRTDEK